MRPLRFLLLLAFFVALPIALTFWSLLTSPESAADSFHAGYNTRSTRLRALFSFSTPSSLFPPSAVISLTNDNSTFFLARPAAFGPGLPSRGLSGQLWVGKGFGDDALLREENINIAGWELGCSDVPGWGEEESKRTQNLPSIDQNQKAPNEPRDLVKDARPSDLDKEDPDTTSDDALRLDDGTDDYLHHPLADSNPATPAHPGEPANADGPDKNKKPTHADIESLQESADIAGKIVMLSRGGCGFLEKVKWAQRRGGVALIVGDNEKGGQLAIMYAKGDTSNVTIPAVFTSYTSAHLLSSLVPPELSETDESPSKGQDGNTKGQANPDKNANLPVFTSTKRSTNRPTSVPSRSTGQKDQEKSWLKKVLLGIGLTDNSHFLHSEDSRRPPSSGNIDWVLVDNWDEELVDRPAKKVDTGSSAATMSTATSKAKSTTSRRSGADDFVIGVQDWRDTDLVAPKPTGKDTDSVANAKDGKGVPADPVSTIKSSSNPEATLKGGSITPGSGEYHHEQLNRVHQPARQHQNSADHQLPQEASTGSWFHVFRSGQSTQEPAFGGKLKQNADGKKGLDNKSTSPGQGDDDQKGLWVTLTPTSVSTSPFFDTLLVLVVSPLVTLTVVYALLLLRSRIRRRRWRAPKSVVERLPVRTYHTMSTTSSTTSSQIASPEHSSPASPLLISTSQSVSQRSPRPRSQTTTGIFPGTSAPTRLSRMGTSPPEKLAPKAAKRKRYNGRQIECVVCLEEYVDGESQVMSLPCGHEFHVECITPWLVTRRRTCPICKGDVVRSLTRRNSGRLEDDLAEIEQTSDDVQNRAAQTVNDEPSAAIPIPTLVRDNSDVSHTDADIERGRDGDVVDPLLSAGGSQQPERERLSLWRNMVSASVGRLSGDTLWRQTPVDRNR